MVAIVNSRKDVRRTLSYNEEKVIDGVAQCIMANLFPKEVNKLTFHDKLRRFTDLNQRNLRTKTNTLHISLNFDPSEKLDTKTLNQIATSYMDRIGFGEQPYLVYEHKDAAHQHVHIVTSIIKSNGKRIPINFIGKNQSQKARIAIEKEFNLVVANGKQKTDKISLQPVNIEKAIYGKSLTKKSIAQIVSGVTRFYKYTSLPELNAVLNQFNVTADRGSEKSKMFEKKGLQYSLINEQGNKVGVPIKASTLPGKPMLSTLEKQFQRNEIIRHPLKAALKEKIDRALSLHSAKSKEAFQKLLAKEKIQVVFRTNPQGRTYGVTFIDHHTMAVFNGSHLGKAYSANAVMEKLSRNADVAQPYRPGFTSSSFKDIVVEDASNNESSILKDLFQSEEYAGLSPEAALRLYKRKRRKGKSM